MSETVITPIATGAPKGAKEDSAVGYFWRLPLSAQPPTDSTSAAPADAVSGGYVGEEGPTLTAELDSDFLRDWNLDQVLQLKQGVTASLEIPVFGWGIDQAKLIYGEDSVIGTADDFTVVWAGELAVREYFILELAGVNGAGRLVAEGQLSSPGQTQFNKASAQTFTLNIPLFKNPNFVDAKDRAGYFKWMDAKGSVAA